jgi:hypothetical protein
MDLEDKERLDRDSARNALEVMIYKCKEILWEDEISAFATEEELEKLKTISSVASEWLEDNAETAKKAELEAQLAILEPLHSKVSFRKNEAYSRPLKVEQFQNLLNESTNLAKLINETIIADNKTANSIENSTDPLLNATIFKPPPLFMQGELDYLVKITERESKWLSAQLLIQQALAANVNPVLLTKDIEDRMRPIQFKMKSLDIVEREAMRLYQQNAFKAAMSKSKSSTSSSSKSSATEAKASETATPDLKKAEPPFEHDGKKSETPPVDSDKDEDNTERLPGTEDGDATNGLGEQEGHDAKDL